MSDETKKIIKEIIDIEKRAVHGKEGTTNYDRRKQISKCIDDYLKKSKL